MNVSLQNAKFILAVKMHLNISSERQQKDQGNRLRREAIIIAATCNQCQIIEISIKATKQNPSNKKRKKEKITLNQRFQNNLLKLDVVPPAAFHWKICLEYPDTKPALRVHSVVGKLPELNLLLADIRGERRSIRVLVHAIPKPKVGSSGRVIMTQDVVRVSNPICS